MVKNIKLIALDADGVLLNYHASYRMAYSWAFKVQPKLVDPQAYWPWDRWDIGHLTGPKLQIFKRQFNEEFWSTIPAVDGAVQACLDLSSAGYELVCVSALKEEFADARLWNLRELGFPIERVIATPGRSCIENPKAAALHDLQPVAFVEDYAPYLRGIPSATHAALILREPNGSPNVGKDLELAHSTYESLAEFSSWWLAR